MVAAQQQMREQQGGAPAQAARQPDILVLDDAAPAARESNSAGATAGDSNSARLLLPLANASSTALRPKATSWSSQPSQGRDPHAGRLAANVVLGTAKPEVQVTGLRPSPVQLSRGPGGMSPTATSINCGFVDVCCHACLNTRSGMALNLHQRNIEREERAQLAKEQAEKSVGIKFRAQQVAQSRKLYRQVTDELFEGHKNEKDRARVLAVQMAAQRDADRAKRAKIIHDRVIAQSKQAAAQAASE